MFKLNNKGFAVSAVLYTLLIAFLMFLGVTLAQFSSSITLINNANKDLVDGQVKLSAQKITATEETKNDEGEVIKTEVRPDIKVQIKSKYGTMYWPKDILTEDEIKSIEATIDKNYCIERPGTYKNIKMDYNGSELTIEDLLNGSTETITDITCP